MTKSTILKLINKIYFIGHTHKLSFKHVSRTELPVDKARTLFRHNSLVSYFILLVKLFLFYLKTIDRNIF